MNYSGSRKPAKNFNLDRGGAIAHPGPFVGVVKGTTDPTHAGRIQVWIKTFGNIATQDNEADWIWARYMTPFYGVTPHKTYETVQNNHFDENGQSYGMWMVAPDVETEVLVVFAEGDPDQAFYIGCIPTPMMNHSIPAMGAVPASRAKINTAADTVIVQDLFADQIPVSDMDRSERSLNNPDYLKSEKPFYKYLTSQMVNSGLIADTLRGPITSSAQRETPSRVFGFNTPGRPVYNVPMADDEVRQKIEDDVANDVVTDTTVHYRKAGHSFVMDDGDIDTDNNLVRIRTSSGHQITMCDDEGKEFIYITHSSGNCWIELGSEGTIDGWAANSVNFRTGGDINLHADKDINLNAGEQINLRATKDMTLETDASLLLTGKTAVTAYSSATIGLKSDGTIALDAGSSGSFKAGAAMTIKGSRVGLNDGSAASVTAPQALSQNSWPDTYEIPDKGWYEEAGKFKSIVSRATTHEPYSGHGAGIANPKKSGS